MRKLKGFTLVELLAAMAIIAILIGLAGFGISLALRRSRDTQREKIIDNLQLTINDYYTRSSDYPSSMSLSNGKLVVEDASGNAVGEGVDVKGPTLPATSTSSSGTLYHYAPSTAGYLLCAQLENDEWFDLSSGGGDCPQQGALVQ